MKATTFALTAALEPSTPRRDPIPFDSRLIEQAIREGVAGILYKCLMVSGGLDSLAQGTRETLQARKRRR